MEEKLNQVPPSLASGRQCGTVAQRIDSGVSVPSPNLSSAASLVHDVGQHCSSLGLSFLFCQVVIIAVPT